MPKPKKVLNLSNKIDSIAEPIVKKGAKYGITANHISLLQIPFVILFVYYLINQMQLTAFFFILISLILDVLDGAWARVTNTASKKGHIMDKALDLIGIYAFLLGVAIGFPAFVNLVIILGIINAIIYASNEVFKLELYCGVRAFGMLGLLLNLLYLAILLSSILGIIMIIYKFGKRLFSKHHL